MVSVKTGFASAQGFVPEGPATIAQPFNVGLMHRTRRGTNQLSQVSERVHAIQSRLDTAFAHHQGLRILTPR